jgi:hypothetical protein
LQKTLITHDLSLIDSNNAEVDWIVSSKLNENFFSEFENGLRIFGGKDIFGKNTEIS